jgi:hypothetical protein
MAITSLHIWEGQLYHYTVEKGRYITTQLGRAGTLLHSWEER